MDDYKDGASEEAPNKSCTGCGGCKNEEYPQLSDYIVSFNRMADIATMENASNISHLVTILLSTALHETGERQLFSINTLIEQGVLIKKK